MNVLRIIFLLVFSIMCLTANTITLTEKEKEFLSSHPVIKVSNELDWQPFDFTIGDEPAGYSIDLLKLIANKIGIKFEFINGYSWGELWKMFEEKKIDIIHPTALNEYRKKFGLYSKHFYSGKHIFMTKQETPKINNIQELYGKTLATPKNWAQTKYFQENFPKIKLLLTQDNNEAKQAVKQGKAYVAMENSAVANYYLKKYMDRQLKINSFVEEYNNRVDNDLYYLIRKDWPLFNSIFQKAFDSIPLNEIVSLQKKWFDVKEPDEKKITLTQDEINYLQTHPRIYVSNTTDYPPFDYAVEKKPMGYSVDLLKTLADKIGMNLTFINGYSWKELIELFKERKLDLLHAATKTQKREKFAIFSKPYYQYQYHLFTKRGVQKIQNLKQLEGKVLTVGKGWKHEDYLALHYPKIKLLPVNSPKEMIKAVQDGKALAGIGGKYTLQYHLKTNQIEDVIINNSIKELNREKNREFYFLAQKDAQPLISMLNKALASLAPGEIDNLKLKWFGRTIINQQNMHYTEQEQEWLNKNHIIKLAYVRQWDDYTDKDAQHIERPYVDLLNKYSPINIQLVLFDTWSQAYTEARKGENVHGILYLSQDKDREKYFSYLPPYYFTPLYLVANKNNKNIQNLSNLENQNIFTTKNSITNRMVQKSKYNITPVPLYDEQEIFQKLSNNTSTVQAAIFFNKDLEKLEKYNLKIVQNLYNQYSEVHLGVNKKQPNVYSILKKAHNSILKAEFARIQNNQADENRINFTAQEQNYLTQKENISLCVMPEYMPFSAFHNGKVDGMASDFIEKISTLINKKFSLQEADNWIQITQRIKNKKCDIVTLVKETDSRKPYLNFTKPVLSTSYVVATINQKFFIDNFEDIKTKSFSAVNESASYEDMKKLYPNINIVPVTTIKEGLEKVLNKEVYGYIGTSASISYAIEKFGYIDFRITSKLPIGHDLAFGVQKDDTILFSIMKKAVDKIDKNEANRVYKKWVMLQKETIIDYSIIWKILLGACLLLAIFIYWNRKMAKTNKLLQKAQKQINLKNKELEHLAITDKLTGIYNRTKLDELLQQEIDRCERSKRTFTFCILDIDNFKKINDTYGHQVGDTVLVEISQILQNSTRKIDSVGRWGGEEFIILCPETKKQGTLTLLESLRIKIESYGFSVAGHQTASFGATCFNIKDDANSIVKRADDALYRAKKEGKNRIIFV